MFELPSSLRGRPHALDPCDTICLTLLFLRRAITTKILSDLFHVSEGTVSSAITRCLVFLQTLCHRVLFLQNSSPKGFATAEAERVPCFDAFGVALFFFSSEFSERNSAALLFFSEDNLILCSVPLVGALDPRLLRDSCSKAVDAAAAFYSAYKGPTTVKVLVGIGVNCRIRFISPAYYGRSSDNEICRDSGWLELYVKTPGRAMADKGHRLFFSSSSSLFSILSFSVYYLLL